MNKKDLTEAVAATQQVLTALLATIQGQTGTPGAQLRYACGQLAANGAAELDAADTSQFWADFANCFDAARLAGATFTAMDVVRVIAENQTPVGIPAIAVQNFSVRLALSQQAQILAATTFTSRESIDAYFDLINVSFEAAIEVAANDLDNVAYVALTAAYAAVSNDLANRARPLPRMVPYSFPTRNPSLWLAQRIYCDPSRDDELIAENKPIHPLFCPPTGVALSA